MKKIITILCLLLMSCASSQKITDYADGKNEMDKAVKYLNEKGCTNISVTSLPNYIYRIEYKENKKRK